MAKRKHDWIAIAQEYVTGGPEVTLEGLAEKYGTSRGGLMTRAADEKWTDQRREYREGIRREAEKIARSTEAKRRAKMLTVADAMKGLGTAALKRTIEDFERDKGKRIDLDDLRLLIKDGTEIERRALGMPDHVLMDGRELDDRLLSLLEELDTDAEE